MRSSRLRRPLSSSASFTGRGSHSAHLRHPHRMFGLNGTFSFRISSLPQCQQEISNVPPSSTPLDTNTPSSTLGGCTYPRISSYSCVSSLLSIAVPLPLP